METRKLLGPALILAGLLVALAAVLVWRGSASKLVREVPVESGGAVVFGEAPSLRSRAEAGGIPPVGERLPTVPLVVVPAESLGEYGGVWRLAMRSRNDHASFIRILGYENLVRWNPSWTAIVPNVAKAVEASPDGREYVFRLREGMHWSDGARFTADDVMFWYEDVLLNPELTAAPPAWLAPEGRVVEVERVDDHTVRFRFATPNGLFLSALAHPQGAEPTAYPKHYLSRFLPEYNPEAAALAEAAGLSGWAELFRREFGTPGTPDSMDRWQNPALPTLNAWTLTGRYGEEREISAVRNPYYWKVDTAGRQLPYIDGIRYTVTDDVGEMVDLALAGEIDMQDRHIGNSALSIIANRERLEAGASAAGYRFFRTVPANMNAVAISLNLNHRDPALRAVFQDRRFRIAFSVALDRPAIIREALGGIGEPYQLAPRPESPLYDQAMAKQHTEHDPARAAALLDEMGLTERDSEGFRLLPDGRRLSVRIDAVGDALVLAMAAEQLRAVGVEVIPSVMDRQAFYERKGNNDHDAAVWAGDGGLDVIQDPRYYFPYSSESNFALEWARAYYQADESVALPEPAARQQALYRRIVGTSDAAEQESLMREILAISREQLYAIGISLTDDTYGIVRNGFRNVPGVMPTGWVYPNPAPTNTCQYYIEKP